MPGDRLFLHRAAGHHGLPGGAGTCRARRPGQDDAVNYRHVIHSLKTKPGAFAGLVYRDQLFPRQAYRRAWEELSATDGEARSARTVLALLALAHEKACEAEFAIAIDEALDGGPRPEPKVLRLRFLRSAPTAPDVRVDMPSPEIFDPLIGAVSNARPDTDDDGDIAMTVQATVGALA